MWEILGGLLIGTAVSGILPLVNAELLVAGAALAVPAAGLPLVALVVHRGADVHEVPPLRAGALGARRGSPSGRGRSSAGRLRPSRARHGATGSLVFTSAAVGLPPFYGVALACGALHVRGRTFLVAGAAGRAVRFGVLAWSARLLGDTGASLLAHRVATTFLGG